MTPDQQLQRLQRYGNDALLVLGRSLLVLASVLLCGAAYYNREPFYLMAACFVALVTLAVLKGTPHLKNAVRASRQGIPFASTLEISINKTDATHSYVAVTRDRFGRRWQFEFLPHGWQPTAGPTAAQLFSISDVAWPVLIRTEQGILYPRYTPKRLEPSSSDRPVRPLPKEHP